MPQTERDLQGVNGTGPHAILVPNDGGYLEALVNDDMKLVPYDEPEERTGSLGDWWAIGKVESSVQNADGSLRTFSVEVGVSLTPHGDFQHTAGDYWQLLAKQLPLIAQKIADKQQ